MKHPFCTRSWISLILFGFSLSVSAQDVPTLVNYQGKLVNSSGLALATGDYGLSVSIYDASSDGNLIWGPQVFDGQPGTGHGPVISVVQGWFNVNMGPLDINGKSVANAFSGAERFVEIQLGENAPFAPRQRILSAPYALNANRASTLKNYETTGQLAIFVSTAGDDENSGLSAVSAKRTIQAAVDLVPDRINHNVSISISPGTYYETIHIEGKQTTSRFGSFKIRGMGAGFDDVVISGANTGSGTRGYGFRVMRSDFSLSNLRIENFTQTAILAQNSHFGLTRVHLVDNTKFGISMTRNSIAVLEDAILELLAQRRGSGIVVEFGSILFFRNDHSFPDGWDGIPDFVAAPSSDNNTIKNYSKGIVGAHAARIIAAQPVDIDDGSLSVEVFRGATYHNPD